MAQIEKAFKKDMAAFNANCSNPVEAVVSDELIDLRRLLDAAETMVNMNYFKPTVFAFERILKEIINSH